MYVWIRMRVCTDTSACKHEYKEVAASDASQIEEGVWDGRSDKNAPEPCFHHNRVQQFL